MHSALDRYFINFHALHNAHLIRATLPRDLLAPIPYFEDRKAKHEEFAAELRKQADKKTTDSGPDGGTTGKKRGRRAGDKGKGKGQQRKRQKTNAGKVRKSRSSAVALASSEPTMVASRSRRTVRQSAKAKEMEERSEDESEASDELSADESSDSESDIDLDYEGDE